MKASDNIRRVPAIAWATSNKGCAGITFNWDGQGYQEPVGWVSANDGMLVFDRDFNQSADNGGELLSNPITQGHQVTSLTSAEFLVNDTWHDKVESAGGLTVSVVGNVIHFHSISVGNEGAVIAALVDAGKKMSASFTRTV